MNIKQQRTSEGSFLLAKDSEIYSWKTKEIYKENTRRLYTVERILEILRACMYSTNTDGSDGDDPRAKRE